MWPTSIYHMILSILHIELKYCYFYSIYREPKLICNINNNLKQHKFVTSADFDFYNRSHIRIRKSAILHPICIQIVGLFPDCMYKTFHRWLLRVLPEIHVRFQQQKNIGRCDQTRFKNSKKYFCIIPTFIRNSISILTMNN